MTQDHRRIWMTVALVAALALLAAAAVACSAQASGSSPTGASSRAAAGRAATDDDWSRIAGALAWMRAAPPSKPVVVLLGGSATRESTISDQSWRSQIQADGGPATLAWNMGSHNRTMAQNVAIVKALPKDAHAVVFVGINLGAFTSTQKSATISLPSPAPPPSSISLQQPHQYGISKTGTLSDAQKKAMLQQWLVKRYPVFKANFANNARLLATLIQVCKTRGYKPVLFELPRNTAIIGSALNAPSTRFRGTCAALARKYGVPWVSFVSRAKIPSPDFYDLWHLVEPGRAVWQKLLSAKTAALLKQYGYDAGS